MSAASHCAVIRNPFSTAVANAKIPDGSVSLSTTCKYSISSTITDTNGSVDLLLAGGFYCGLTANATIPSTISTPLTFDKQINFQYGTPSRLFTSVQTGTSPNFTASIRQGVSAPNQYRIVSQGLRISLINNSQDNDGWFEAIRCTPSNSYTDWGVAPEVVAQVGNGTTVQAIAAEAVTICPNMNRYEGSGDESSSLFLPSQSNWAMNPSYIAGKARDLHKYNFVLHRQESNDFIEIPQQCTLTNGPAFAGAQTCPNPLLGTNNLTPWWVDKQMDSILIRIRSNTSGANAGSMVLHVHMVQHVEECYDERSDLFRFMTKCPTNMSLYNATMQAMKRDIKPAFIRSPTLAVSSPSYSSYKRKSKRRRR